MSKHINMSSQSVPICQRVLESLEAFYDNRFEISRVEEETHFDGYRHFFDAVGALNLHHEAKHMIDLDDTPDWAMSGDSNTTGLLCIAFEDGNGHITLLRQVCERNKNGVPYVSQAWLPEYNFTKESPISLSEQIDILERRYYDSSPKKPLVFRYAFMDDEEDDSFKKPCPKCDACGVPESDECKSDCAYQAKRKAECEAEEAIELLVSKGMLKKNSEGEYEFQPVKFTPGRIGRIGGSD